MAPRAKFFKTLGNGMVATWRNNSGLIFCQLFFGIYFPSFFFGGESIEHSFVIFFLYKLWAERKTFVTRFFAAL